MNLASVKTIDIQEHLDKLYQKKYKLDREYFDITQTLVRGGKISEQRYQKYLQDMQKVVADIDDTIMNQIKNKKHYHVLSTQNIKKTKSKSSPNVTKVLERNKEALLKAFKFKTKEECASSKRSQPYYMSKTDLVSTIEKNPDIKKLMPSGYKSKTKEEICDSLFKKN